MGNSTKDGLGYEELGEAGSQVVSAWVTGSVVSQDMVSGLNLWAAGSAQAAKVFGTTFFSGLNAFLTGSVQVDKVIGDVQVTGLNFFATGSMTAGRGFFASTVSGAGLGNFANTVVAGSEDVDVVYSNAGSPYYNGTVLQFTTETIITGGMWVTVSGGAGGATVLARAAAASTTPLGVATATAGSNATVNVLTQGVTYLTADGTIANATQIRMGAGAALNTVAQATVGSGARGVALAGAGSEGLALVYLW